MPRVLNRRATLDDRAKLETIVREQGWSIATMNRAAAEIGLHPRTIRRIWNSTVRYVAGGESVGDWVRNKRDEQLARLEYISAKATAAGDFSAAAKVEMVYAQVAGTLSPTKILHSGAVSVTHSAAVAAVSKMSHDELRLAVYQGTEQPREVLEAAFEPVVEAAEAPPEASTAPEVPPAVARALARLSAGRGGSGSSAG